MQQAFAEQFKAIAMAPNLAQSLERAHAFAREQSHRAVLLEHLLLALTEDPDAAVVLKASNVDLDRLGTDVSGYLGGLLEDMRAESGAEPRPDGELLRVMQAAGQAAQQSRRKQIDGAIVLAAVVGDGKSPAAGLLKAHGLTFEEAIRALQKANAQLRTKKFASLPAAPAEPAAGEATSAAGESRAQAQPQSVDDILAAARARIQQRSTPAKSESKPAPPPEPEPDALSSLASAKAARAPSLAARADEAAAENPEAEAVALPASPPPDPAGAPSPAPPFPGPPNTRSPFPVRPAALADGATLRPPLPSRGGAAPVRSPGARPQRAPWPDRAEPQAPPRPVGPNGAAARPVGPQRPGGRTGPLVETIPRRMRVGIATPAQVRIARDRIDGLIALLLDGRGAPPRPEGFVTRALSVRLKAPDGGFWIEPGSPETIWVDSNAAQTQAQDDHASWRWTVVPQRRGRCRLVLMVTARTVGRDGTAAETAPPDRVIEVRVRGSAGRGFKRWIGLLTLILAAAALGKYGTQVVDVVTPIIKQLIGG